MAATKLMRLGVTNRIANDSDFKPFNFDCLFRSDLDFNDEFELTIAISIDFQSNYNYNPSISIVFWSFLINWLKMVNLYWKCNEFDKKCHRLQTYILKYLISSKKFKMGRTEKANLIWHRWCTIRPRSNGRTWSNGRIWPFDLPIFFGGQTDQIFVTG